MVFMKPVLILVSVLSSPVAMASDTLTLKETGYDSERNIVARIYAKDIEKAKSTPTMVGEMEPAIAVATIDLDRDGKPEIVARIMHSYWCGSHGCKLIILTMQPDGTWKEIASLISHDELEVHDEVQNNYKTITFRHSNKIWVFQNGKYQQSKP